MHGADMTTSAARIPSHADRCQATGSSLEIYASTPSDVGGISSSQSITFGSHTCCGRPERRPGTVGEVGWMIFVILRAMVVKIDRIQPTVARGSRERGMDTWRGK